MPTSSVGAPRLLLRRLREVMAQRESAQVRRDFFGCFDDVRGMPANGGINVRELIGELDSAPAFFQGSADGDDLANASGFRARDDVGYFIPKFGKIEVSVGIVERWFHFTISASHHHS